MRPRPTRPADGCAWITGASSGIGRTLALELVARGWTVAATARREAELVTLAAEATGRKGSILPFAGDVADADAMAALADRIAAEAGPVALAVLNAGIYLPVAIETLTVEAFRRSVDVNVMGVVHALVPLVAAMRARGRGHIAVVSSVTGYGGLPTSAAYGATKAALINMAESLKFDLDPLNIRLQIICPGFVETPATAGNPFPMPFLVPAEQAARRIADGLARGGFEITFPRRFTWQLKALRFLPYWLYFRVVGGRTGQG